MQIPGARAARLTEDNMKYDLIIAGGGYTGVAAAIAAKRGGLSRVLIVEETNALGGATGRSLVIPFMPYYTPIRPQEGEQRKMLSCGIFAEICDRLKEVTRQVHGEDTPLVQEPYATYSEEYLKVVLNRMVREAGAEVLFHTSVIAADREGDRVRSVTLSNVSGVHTYEADAFIDCTGDADLCVQAGCPTHTGREGDGLCQPMTLCFRLGDIDRKRFYEGLPETQKKYKEWQAAGKIRNVRENILVFHTYSETVMHFNTTRVILHDPTDAVSVTDAEMEAREQVWEMFLFLRECAAGCENASLLSTAMQIGVRESRMIDGEYTLAQDDLTSCRKAADGIAACNYDIDIHNPEGTGTSHWFFPPHEYYTIPYRCLIPRGMTNLLAAGRCISSTHEAQASYRIMPVVCTLGEAAGTAVALAKELGCDTLHLDTGKLRDRLRQNGCVVD